MNLYRRSISAVFLLGVAVSACSTSSPSSELQDSIPEVDASTDALSVQAVSLGATY